MACYRQVGDIPPARHTQHRRPDGGVYYEDCPALLDGRPASGQPAFVLPKPDTAG
jgi:hypothetical protein